MNLFLFVPVGKRRHARPLLEEIRQGALVAEVKSVGNFAHRKVRLRQQVAYFLIHQRSGVLVDGGAADFPHEPREVGSRNVQFVGIEAYLSFLAEVAVEVVEKHLIHLLLVAEVVRNGTLFVGQLLYDKLQHVEHAPYHFNLVDVLMAHNVAHEMENVQYAPVFLVGEQIDRSMVGKVLVHEHALRLKVSRHRQQLSDIIHRQDDEAPLLQFQAPVSIAVEQNVAAALLHEKESCKESPFLRRPYEDAAVVSRGGAVGGVCAENIAQMITGCKFFQIVYFRVHVCSVKILLRFKNDMTKVVIFSDKR